MNAMPLTTWVDRIGHIILNVTLVAAIPTALVAFLVQSF